MKSDKIKKISHVGLIIFIILIIFGILSNYTFTNAADMKKIYSAEDGADVINDKAGKFLAYAIGIGVAAGVVMIAVLGVKYILASPEGKADLKKQAVMYFIGAALIVSGSTFLGIIADAASKWN